RLAVFDLQQVDRLRPEIAEAITEDALHFRPRQIAAKPAMRGIFARLIAKRAQIDVKPFGFVGFAQSFAGEVEIVKDALAGIKPGPWRLRHHAGDDITARLPCRPSAGKSLADV